MHLTYNDMYYRIVIVSAVPNIVHHDAQCEKKREMQLCQFWILIKSKQINK